MKIYTINLFVISVLITGCSSTSSVLINQNEAKSPQVAVMPLHGAYGQQASDFITEQLATKGVATIERAQLNYILREHGFKKTDQFNQSSLAEYGRFLGVKKMLTGTISSVEGPLYSFPHVNITLKVVDVSTGQITWVGRYGNSFWTSAISTQGDIQRGAKKIVKEFVKVHGTQF